MGQPSTIDRLPAEIREKIGQLRNDGRTIDEILAKLQELDVEVSRSALARHTKELDAIGELLRGSRGIAEAMVAQFGDAPENKTARLNVELAHALVTKCMLGKDGGSVMLDPKEVNLVADSLYRLAKASKDDVDREVKIREKIKAEMERKAAATAKAVSKELKKAGLSDEARRKIETEILGIQR
jgi:hypothetical protein